MCKEESYAVFIVLVIAGRRLVHSKKMEVDLLRCPRSLICTFSTLGSVCTSIGFSCRPGASYLAHLFPFYLMLDCMALGAWSTQGCTEFEFAKPSLLEDERISECLLHLVIGAQESKGNRVKFPQFWRGLH